MMPIEQEGLGRDGPQMLIEEGANPVGAIGDRKQRIALCYGADQEAAKPDKERISSAADIPIPGRGRDARGAHLNEGMVLPSSGGHFING
jgi:hypothetical protein